MEYLEFGASIRQLHGCDLLPHRLQRARARLPLDIPLVAANGQYLPYRSQAFDLVCQYTVFSSILSNEIKCDLAKEMLRVLKPGGMILWYDFWLNPSNPQTKGIKPSEIRQLFPNCLIELHKITLAPPLTRVLVNASWMMCFILEKMLVLNTHYLAKITPL
jgi:ubiquinone/menaquinone biosynthesis C-methylase UbiE